MRYFRVLACWLFFFEIVAKAQEVTVTKTEISPSAWRPDSLVSAHGAYSGSIAAGVGYKYWDAMALDFLYGYTPEDIAGQDIHSLSVKVAGYLGQMIIARKVRVRPYLGINLIYSPDNELFVMLPSQYPDGYYASTAFRPALVGGLDVQVGQKMALGYEFAVLDSELAYWRDSKRFDANRMGSSGVYIRWILGAER